MSFGAIEDAAGLVLLFVVFGVPALAVAARLAIRPMVDAVVRLREAAASPPLPQPDPRLAALEAEVARLRQDVRRLAEAETFARQLEQGPGAAVQASHRPLPPLSGGEIVHVVRRAA